MWRYFGSLLSLWWHIRNIAKYVRFLFPTFFLFYMTYLIHRESSALFNLRSSWRSSRSSCSSNKKVKTLNLFASHINFLLVPLPWALNNLLQFVSYVWFLIILKFSRPWSELSTNPYKVRTFSAVYFVGLCFPICKRPLKILCWNLQTLYLLIRSNLAYFWGKNLIFFQD